MKTSITVQNLRCDGCKNTISKKLNSIQGLNDLEIDIDAQTISYNADNDNVTDIVLAQLKALGYPQETDSNSMALKTKSFFSCASGKLQK